MKKEEKEEIKDCPKCGGERGRKLIGDESYDWCDECGVVEN